MIAMNRSASQRLLARSALLALLAIFSCGPRQPSDEDLLERFVETITGPVDDTYVPRTLAYVDFATYPVDLQTPMHQGVYDEEHAEAIKADLRRAVARLQGSKLKRRSSRIEIDKDTAAIELGLVSALGPFDAQIGLRKYAPGIWRVTRVRLRR